MTQEEKTKLLNVLKNFDNISTYIFDLLSPISKMREKYSCTEEEACHMKLQAEDYLSKYGCLTIDATNTTTGFDPRYMQITLDHDGVTSYLAFADPNSAQYNVNSITWSFCSNAFWGEDPTGEWTLSVYNLGSDNTTFNISNVVSSFYMGELETSHPEDVPEPSTWALMALGVVIVFLRRRK